eukprot:1123678-Amorphochlora_amoeboformis.AAC.3
MPSHGNLGVESLVGRLNQGFSLAEFGHVASQSSSWVSFWALPHGGSASARKRVEGLVRACLDYWYATGHG